MATVAGHLKEFADKTTVNLLNDTMQYYAEAMKSKADYIREGRLKLREIIDENYQATDKIAGFALYAVTWTLQQYLASTMHIESAVIIRGRAEDALSSTNLKRLKDDMTLEFWNKLVLADFLFTLDRGFGYTIILGSKDLYPYLLPSMSNHIARLALIELQFYMNEMQSVWLENDCVEKENIVYAK